MTFSFRTLNHTMKHNHPMKRTISALLLAGLLCCPALLTAAAEEPDFLPGVLRVRLTGEALSSPGCLLHPGIGTARVTGLASVDSMLVNCGLQGVAARQALPANLELARNLGLDRDFLLHLDPLTDIPALATRLSSLLEVERAEPDWLLKLCSPVDDPFYGEQWGHDNAGQMNSWDEAAGSFSGPEVGTVGFDSDVDLAWSALGNFGSPDIIIAVLDTGFDLQHPDLSFVGGYDFGDHDADPQENPPGTGGHGHGTGTAGIAAAVADNGIGVAGVAGGCPVMPLKVTTSSGSLPASAVSEALIFAADNGARVASMSFGLDIVDPGIGDEVNYAFASGVTLVAATGNNNAPLITFPARYSNVIAIGAASPCGERKRSTSEQWVLNLGVLPDPRGVTCDNAPWWGSNFGYGLDFLAPSIIPTTDVQGTGGFIDGDYFLNFNGTSASAPFAAGVAALILSQHPTLHPGLVKLKMIQSATDVVDGDARPGYDRASGFGLVNAGQALSPSSGTCLTHLLKMSLP